MTFPILATEEIIVSLSELGINITEDDLVKARPEVLKNVFDQLIILVLNVTKDELYQAKFSGLAAVDENSELHEESVHIVHWMRSMCVVDPSAVAAAAAGHTTTSVAITVTH